MRLALVLALLLAGCGSGRRSFEEPVVLGGVEVAPEVLNHGEIVFMSRCRGCHGAEGRGDGPYAASMEPSPADLTSGRYPRAAPEGGLPSDEALREILVVGIEGTPMGPQDLGDEEREAVLQYSKTLAPAWR